jgi:hypothetical protein
MDRSRRSVTVPLSALLDDANKQEEYRQFQESGWIVLYHSGHRSGRDGGHAQQFEARAVG